MHLLIDVRTTSPSDIPFLHYGMLWSDSWQAYHPNDTITFLAHENDPLEGRDTLFVKTRWHGIGKKRIAHHAYGPDRIISFSRLPSYDSSIKQITHVSDLSPLLYPTVSHNALEHSWKMREYNQLFKKSHKIILPHLDIGTGIGELFNIDEEKMSVIPYLSASNEEIYKIRTILPHGVFGDYFITEGSESEEWRPLELLEAFGTYIHRMGGTEKLIILGNIGNNMGGISSMIRTLDLLDFVKIIGVLTKEDRELLYAQSKGWIYAGSYYSRGPSVAIASGYSRPLFFCDIPGLRDYTGIYFHPNHLDRLPELLRSEKEKYQIQRKTNNEVIMQVYARIISE